MALERYASKRNFSRTPEPKARAAKGKKAASHLFVIQKHAARRLHYDLRLELGGVLKSWAVTRGPSLVPGDRRLAVEVEDHPLDYADFEGTIPKGEYGGGRVIVWDRGRWTPVGDPEAGLRKGHLKFELRGKKLSGQFDLVRMQPRDGGSRNNWLLLKSKDDYARTPSDPDVLVERPESVKSGKTIDDMEDPLAADPPARGAGRKVRAKEAAAPLRRSKPQAPFDAAKLPRAKAAALPGFVEMQLASLSAKAPGAEGWFHEIKFDGYRLQARIDRGRVQLRTRAGLDWTAKFPAIAKALAGLDVAQALIDGEVVAETGEGLSSFAELQAALKAGKDDRLVYYVFDLLHLDGFDLTATPLTDRKRALSAVVPPEQTGFVRLSETFDSNGEALKKHACRIGLEGIVSKRANAPYRSGRGSDWLKIKCSNRQELIVVGYVPSTTARRAIGSLALGLFEGEELRYAGKVGTGFSTRVAEELWERLEPLRRDKPTAKVLVPASEIRKLRWVEPRLVAEIEFREWTASGLVRHAVFQGLRLDKEPKDVTRERTMPSPKSPRTPAKRDQTNAEVKELTHPDRIYWSDAGISKQGLADYYTEVWDWIAPHIVNRPLALVRCPGGIDESCFFQKHAWKGLDARLISAAKVGDDDVLFISSLPGALALVQAGVLEIHPWGSTMDDPEHPDRLVFDLDPGDGVAWSEVEATALSLRDRLARLGLRSFAKTTGGKGLHVVVPLTPSADWATAKRFAATVASDMAAEAKDRYTAKLAKSARRGKIFIDYLRNGRGATAVAAYSPRARAGAPVATPVAWEELGTGITPAHFTLLNIRRRLSSLAADPWARMAATRQKLPKN